MVTLTGIAVEWLATGALLLVLGALVKFKQWAFLIAGYDESSPVPKEVASNLVGNTVLRLGVALLVVGGIASLTTLPEYMSTIITVVVVLAVVRLLYRLNTYTPAEA